MKTIPARRIVAIIGFLTVCAAASLHVLGQNSQSRRAASQAATAPANRPATQPASKPAPYPPPALVEACTKEAKALAKRLDKNFAFAVSPPFVVAGNLTTASVDSYTRHTIVAAAKAMWATDFKKKPDQVITVLLLADDLSYRTWAKKLFNDDDVSHYGYYKPTERTMVMNISTGGGTLVHELTHALIVYDFPDVPAWFNEGLGSLHEQCNITLDGLVGLVNWRLPALQEAIKAGKLRPLRELAMMGDDFYTDDRGHNYAQARYFCQYMQDKDVLGTFYAYYRDNHAGKDAGPKAIEHVFGKTVEEVEKDFLAWVKPLKFGR